MPREREPMPHEEELENLPNKPEVPKEPCLYEENPLQAYMWARDAWWRGRESAKSISEIIDVPLYRVNTWVQGYGDQEGWKAAKARVLSRQFQRYQEDEAEKVEKILSKMFSLLGGSVEKLLDANVQLSVGEFRTMASAAESLFKMRQLMLGRSTEIFGVGDNKDVTWDNIVQKIREVDILDYKEVKNISEAKVLDGKKSLD